MKTSAPPPRYNAPAVRKALRVIELLCGSPHPLGLSEISRATGLNKNMAFRLVNTLQSEGWVTAEEPGPRYRMTLVPFQVTSQPANRLSVKEVALQPLRGLWERIGESVYLGILYEDQVLYLEHFDSLQNVRIAGMVGARYPLHCTAPGKVLLAYGAEKLLSRVIRKGIKPHTEATLAQAAALRKELALTRRRGFALDHEEFSRGLICCAVPVRNFSGEVVGTIGLSTTTFSHTMDDVIKRFSPLILHTADEISTRLGWKQPK